MRNRKFCLLNTTLLLFGLFSAVSAAAPSKHMCFGGSTVSGLTAASTVHIQTPSEASYSSQNNPLSGTYTIGPAGTGSFDYPDVAGAVVALHTNGVSAHTTFLISPGIYQGQISIDSVPGAGPNATVTFRSSLMDSSTVILQHASVSSADNWVIRLNGTSHVQFAHMTFRATGLSYGRVFSLAGNSGNIAISNSRIETDTISIANNYACIYQDNNNGFQQFSLTNCALIGGYYSVYWNSSSGSTRGNGFIASGNILRGYYLTGFYINGTDSIQILKNNLRNRQGLTGIQAVYIIGTSGYGDISSNIIETFGPGGQQGIYLMDKAGIPAVPLIISNNVITQNGNTSWSMYGIYIQGCSLVDVYYNSVRVNGGTAANGRAFMQTTSYYINVVNNIFSNYNGGYAYYINTPAGILMSDHNNLYTTGVNLAYWGSNKTNLSALIAASQKDSASKNVVPPFASLNDLHLTNNLLSGFAKALSSVQADIDGKQRSPFPTIGAYEMPLIQFDAGVFEVITPGSQTVAGMLYPVEVKISNEGYDTLYSVMIQYRINGGVVHSSIFNAALLPKQLVTVQLPDMTSPAGQYILKAWTVVTGDTNFHNDTLEKPIFGKPQFDVSAVKVFGPVDGCRLGPDTIRLWIKNTGVQSLNTPGSPSLTLGYRVVGLPAIYTGTISQTLLPGDSLLYSFLMPYSFIDYNHDSIYTLSAWASLAGGLLSSNDTATANIYVSRSPMPPVVSPVTIPHSTSVVLTAQSPDSMHWFPTFSASVALAAGPSFATPVLIHDTVFWVEARSPEGSPPENLALNAVSSQSSGGSSTFGPQNYNDGNISPDPNNSWGWVSTNGWIEYSWTQEVTFNTVRFIKGNRPMTSCTLQYYQNGAFVDFLCYNGTALNDSVMFPTITTGKLRFFAISGAINPNFREIQVVEPKKSGCTGPRTPLVVNVLSPAPCDVGVTQYNTLGSKVYLSTNESVSVRIKNTGTAVQSGIPVSLRVDNQPAITEVFPGSIPPGNFADYTFSTTVDLSDTGATFLITAWTSLLCDSVPQNDSAKLDVTHLPPTYCVSSAQSSSYGEITHVSVGTLSNTTPASGARYSDFTGIIPPPVLTSGIPYALSIMTGTYNSYSGTTHRMKGWIDFNRDGILNPQDELIFSRSSTNFDAFSVPLNIPHSASSGPTLMRITMQNLPVDSPVTPCNTYFTGETEDYLVVIANQANVDASLIEIKGITNTQNTSTPLWLKFMNCGTEPVLPGTLTLACQVNNAPPMILPFSGGLMPGFIDSILVPGVLLQMGDNMVRAYTILPGDVNQHNDTQVVAIHRFFHKNLPFADDFETGDYWFTPGVLSNWERGAPSGNIINSTWSGYNVWTTRLAGNHFSNPSDYLYSPVFDFTALPANDTVVLSFAHWLAMVNWSYGHVESSVDSGITWSSVGFYLDTNGTNWYNATSGGVHYFTNNNSGWMKSSYKLNPSLFNNQPAVQFRFHFYSNQSGVSNGWAIDSFSLSLPPAADEIGVTDLIHPSTDTVAGSIVFPVINLTNYGTNTQTTIPLEIRINGSTVMTETWTGSLPSNGSIAYTFGQSFVVPLMQYEICATSSLPGDQYPGNDQYCNMFHGVKAENDAGMVRILSPATDSGGNICFYDAQSLPWYQYDMMVRIKNDGRNILSSIPIQYSFDNGTTSHTDFWNGNLLPGDSIDLSLGNLFMPALGLQLVCVETAIPGDPYLGNNQVCKPYTGVLCTGSGQVEAVGFRLDQNVPNPAGDHTLISFQIPAAGSVTFGLVNNLGQIKELQSMHKDAGINTIYLNVANLSPGLYHYFIEYQGMRLARKMIITP